MNESLERFLDDLLIRNLENDSKKDADLHTRNKNIKKVISSLKISSLYEDL
jgi:hypothetical protein